MISLDNYALSDFGLSISQGHSHPNPEQNDKTMSIPGRAGAWDFGTEIGVRQFNVPVMVIERNKSVYKRKFVNLLLFC